MTSSLPLQPLATYAEDPHSGPDSNPLSTLNLTILKSLSDKKTRDGQTPKRRGPKPDSKPALTRRQELNRQAQRTHRERKELYIKALEDEVLRLKEIFGTISQDKERLAEENRRLKAKLAQNDAAGDPIAADTNFFDQMVSSPSGPSPGYTSSSSMLGSESYLPGGPSSQTTFPSPPSSTTTSPAYRPPLGGPRDFNTVLGDGAGVMVSKRDPDLDYDQAGIDFVLTLERPCMEHMTWLLERGTGTEDRAQREPCGHALMASCPPEPFSELSPESPFGHTNTIHAHAHGHPPMPTSISGGGQRTWELSKADLATLLDLSKRLDLDGEITPVMAWGMILAHPRLAELQLEDFARLTEELGSKVRCYGFGAVMEEFEVRDALENLFSTKPDGRVFEDF
ncbi:hypothetical protein GE21DRAFT_1634 [Neurospora crassa]|uniref:BZIP-type transcription factor n=1 Tax=Neurospora crassa (strain ATCC 24698 / 74-OR23-1A / CBS 708.71 / DSM 1257 / FGSC 987) TaxID=367110 RepID=V5IQW8_NEUCR|nr:bZIP-type transcription factor, variant [Neurospora crassa OR74A]XP_011393157.1 bZIP-type transcription factor [Neurospora crassa OR74A]ESA44189.1 bZIP-type transcription factor [Neurospora crassa OR74A]ESA44190.1 bZIP-type transcription factor, variant [Neurospora crassa OR74A]KHE79747.1 hypothetical protein GE21DRAFT_1634 [Neurospora crassa]|eukprot:XP_011393156.1 bZIP-type transcription factor, variant [Neurospora crassa OR74A]